MSAPARSAARRRVILRRRLTLLVGVGVVAAIAAIVIAPLVDNAVREFTLPLRHEDIIRQQAREKGVDAALIAAVIYAESHFRDQTSDAGAKGLMQITPATAEFIERKSGGSTFRVDDLSEPQINIAYGTWYLRYLLGRYGSNEALALAAYNGGEGNVDKWIGEAAAAEKDLRVDDIPFPETREYVKRVESAKSDYREHYAGQLGY